ncbi:MAG: hypothetical protein B7Z19_03115 [Polynucleobacter sp. 32-46-5]|nr:MAG: hypothetical protein B7Z19_03115 [Polynucleobacter sp. 32-46-5]
MTQTFATNANNDIYIGGDGNLAIASGIQGVLQACATASKAQLGEMVLAVKSGIPNFQTVWVGAPNYAVFTAYLRNTLLAVDGVTDVQSLTLNAVNGVLKYTAVIVTKYGTAATSG